MIKKLILILSILSLTSCTEEEELKKDKPFESGNVFSHINYADEVIIENYMRGDSL